MVTKTTVDNLGHQLAKIYSNDKDKVVVILPLTYFEELLTRLEDFEDLVDHWKEMKSYHNGEGRSFNDFLTEYHDDTL